MTTAILQQSFQSPKFYDFEKSNNRRNMRRSYVKSSPPSWAFVVAAWLLWLSSAAHRLARWLDGRALLIEAWCWHRWQRGRVRWVMVVSVVVVGWMFWIELAKGGAIQWMLSSLPPVLAA